MITDTNDFANIEPVATPLHKAWLQAKAHNLDHLVFVEYEDVYLTYATDAMDVHGLFENLTIINRRCEYYQVAMLGIPIAEMESYLPTLISHGHKPFLTNPGIL